MARTGDDDEDGVERTEDGRFIVVGGRRWRASDPEIPDNLRQELVNELMDARRAIGRGDETARTRVQQAKVALGERGHPWWERQAPDDAGERIEAAVLALLSGRRGKTICPSDAARVVGGERWRTYLDAVRTVGARLQDEGHLTITQRGEPVDLATVKGPVRFTPVPTDP